MGKVVLSSEEATWAPAASLPLAAHPGASPHAAGPAPGMLQAPISLTSLLTFSRLCPHTGHFTTSEPRSFVSRPGARITRASWGALPSILLQP